MVFTDTHFFMQRVSAGLAEAVKLRTFDTEELRTIKMSLNTSPIRIGYCLSLIPGLLRLAVLARMVPKPREAIS
jgi:hypothetical protein